MQIALLRVNSDTKRIGSGRIVKYSHKNREATMFPISSLAKIG